MSHAIEFIETSIFTRQIKALATDDELKALQVELIAQGPPPDRNQFQNVPVEIDRGPQGSQPRRIIDLQRHHHLGAWPAQVVRKGKILGPSPRD